MICNMSQQVWVPIHSMHNNANCFWWLRSSFESICMQAITFRFTLFFFLNAEKTILDEAFFWKNLIIQWICWLYFLLVFAFLGVMLCISLFIIVKMIENLFRWLFLQFYCLILYPLWAFMVVKLKQFGEKLHLLFIKLIPIPNIILISKLW